MTLMPFCPFACITVVLAPIPPSLQVKSDGVNRETEIEIVLGMQSESDLASVPVK